VSTTEQNSKSTDDWQMYELPVNVEGNNRYALNPMAVIDHANNDESRELVKEVGEDSITYTIYSGMAYSEEDATQSSWRIDYGVEFSLNGLVRKFLNVDNNISSPDSYADSIASDIFPKLEERTEKYYQSKQNPKN